MFHSFEMRFVLFFAWLIALEASQINNPFIDVENDVKTELRVDNTLIRELIQRMEFLEARDRSHAQEIDELKQELGNQKHEIAKLHEKNEKQDRLVSRLMQRLLLRGRNPAAEPSKSQEGVDMPTVESKENRIRRSENEVTVAFTTALTHTVQHMGAQQNIVFDHVETNVGNGYNSNHGIFTAPVSGIYFFYTSVLSDQNREVYCQIVVNGNHKVHVYARGTDGRFAQGGQALIVQLQKGDNVAVQNAKTDDAIYGDAALYTTFSGFLLQEIYPQSGSIVG